ncbi:MAG: translation initiation factor 2 [Oscillospiraceae bacterium]|nr:translation initiation factor 2 [Oscillospiraceae bacterium]MBQ4545280.1 translation initiation factor 2 [Oscillospiraceae bacterium]MBQ6902139.1 translation initiation factor 2 [Oscillospiraceae bacterium]
MVKGVTKRVIVVKAPVSSMFDEAIFILGAGTLSEKAVDAENILHEACAVADDYVRTHCGGRKRISKQSVITCISCITSLVLLIALICNTLL